MGARGGGSVRGFGRFGAAKPNAPTINSVTIASTSSVTIAYTLGANNGASITTIGIVSSPSTALTFTNTDLDGSILVTGTFLTNQSYTFTMTATNAAGTSDSSSASNSVTPIVDPSFIGMLGGVNTEIDGGIAVDSSGNFYLVGSTAVSGVYDIFVAKYNSVGTIQWQRRIGNNGSSLSYLGYGVTVDSSGNVYITGRDSGGFWTSGFIAKYNSSGTLQWQKQGALQYMQYKGCTVDSSGNVYLTGEYVRSGDSRPSIYFAKFDSSGSITLGKDFYTGNVDRWGTDIAVDSSGNIYVAGRDASSGSFRPFVGKFNSSGVASWTQNIVSSDDLYGIDVDSSGNVYVCGTTNDNKLLVAKYNTSGTIQWSRSLGTSSTGGRSIVSDSSGNIYVLGTTSGDALIAKYNTSGDIQWQRTFGTSASEGVNPVSIGLSSAGFIYISGANSISGNNDFFFAKLPIDGSKTGTYTVNGYTYAYTSSSLTDTSKGYTSTGVSFTSSNPSATANDPGKTSTTTTLGSFVTTI